MLIVRIDPHSRSHVAAAIDEQGRLVGGIEVDAGVCGLAQLTAWIETLPQPRLLAIETHAATGSRSFGCCSQVLRSSSAFRQR